MELAPLKNAFRGVLMKWIVSKLDVEAVRYLLNGLLETLKASAAATENRIDDAAIADVEYLINKGELLEALVELLKGKLNPKADGFCTSSADAADEIADLVLKSCQQSNGVCESTAAVTVVIQILQVVFPLILSYLKDTQPEPEE